MSDWTFAWACRPGGPPFSHHDDILDKHTHMMRAFFMKKYKEKALSDDILTPSLTYVTTGKLDY